MTSQPWKSPGAGRVVRLAAMALGLVSIGTGRAHAEASSPDLAVGYSHACAIKGGGTLWCWGANDSGQVGDGTTTTRTAAVPVSSLGGGVAEVASGDDFSCARKLDGTLWCWGNNASGQLGDGTTFDSLLPIPVGALGTSVGEVSLGDTFACARKTDGTLWCWGAGFLGDGSGAGSLTPIPVTALGSGVAEVATGNGAACARKGDGTLWCWGDNTFGVLGNGTDTASLIPAQVTALGNDVAGVAMGDLFACARKTDGTLWCWGTNDKGQLGDGTMTSHFTPAPIAMLGNSVVGVAANGRHACARLIGGTLRCWGWNVRGELGDGSTTDRPLPIGVTGFGSAIVEVSAGENHVTCARTAAGDVFCSGVNDAGQLGDGTTTNRNTPVRAIAATSAAVPAVGGWGLTLLALLLAAMGVRLQLGSVTYVVTGPGGFTKTDSIDVSNSATVSGIISGLPAGAGYALSLTAVDTAHRLTGCQGSATFDVVAASTTPVTVHLTCHEALGLGGAGLATLRRRRPSR